MNDLSFQKSPDKSQISYFLLCNYIGLFIPVGSRQTRVRQAVVLLKHAQSLQLAGDKSHTILLGRCYTYVMYMSSKQNLAGSALFLPQGGTHFQLVPLGSPQGYFMGKFSPLTSIKFLPPMPPIKKWSKLFAPEKLKRLEKIDFQHTTIILGLVNK